MDMAAFSRSCCVVALLLVAARASRASFPESPLDSGVRFHALAASQKAELGVALEKVVNRLLKDTSHPEALWKSLVKEGGETLVQNDADHDKQCLSDLDRWKKALSTGETWALQMADSTSKFVTGILYGQNADLGDFDECVESTPGTLGTDDDFTGLYALSTLSVFGPTTNTSVQGTSNDKPLAKVRFAICAPSTCRVEYLQTALKTQLATVKQLTGIQLNVQISLDKKFTSLYGGYRQRDTLDWSIAALAIVLGVVVAVATFADVTLGSDSLNPGQGWCSRLVIAFSATRNAKKLLSVGSGGDTMGCIHGIRVFSMLWIVQGHRWGWGMSIVPFTNLKKLYELLEGNYVFTILVFDGILSVDTFFVIGGIVNTYVFMNSVKKTNSFNIFHYYLHRYLRLMPSFMFVIAVSASWLSLLGNGPLWYWVNDTSISCKGAWWSHILFLGNYVNVEHQCHVLWYPNTDMQLFWVSPLILLPLWKRPRLGLPWLVFLIAGSCIVPLAIAIVRDYRFVIPLLADYGNRPLWRDQYWGSHMRATPYFVGLLAGYFLYLIKIEKRAFRLSKTQTLLAWLGSTLLSLAVMVPPTPLFDSQNVAYNAVASGFYIGLSRLGWSIVVSWIVTACVTGYAGPVNTFLSWSPFAVIGRLTFGIYLVHNLVQQVDYGLYRAAESYSPYRMTLRMLSDFLVATFIAALLSILIESPILTLEKWLLGNNKKPKELPQKEKLGAA